MNLIIILALVITQIPAPKAVAQGVNVEIFDVIACPSCIFPDGCTCVYASFHNANNTTSTGDLRVVTKLYNYCSGLILTRSIFISGLGPDEYRYNVLTACISNCSLPAGCYTVVVEVWKACACPSHLLGSGTGYLYVYSSPEYDLDVHIQSSDARMPGSYVDFTVTLKSTIPSLSEPCPPCCFPPCPPCPNCIPYNGYPPCQPCCCDNVDFTKSFHVTAEILSPSGAKVWSSSEDVELEIPGEETVNYEYHIPADAEEGI